MQQNNLTARHKDALKYALKQIEQSDITKDIFKIILYGSAARGDSKFQSDIDLLFIMKTIDETNKRQIICLKGDIMPPDINSPEIDAKFITKNTWETDNSFYIKNVRRDGICIWQ